MKKALSLILVLTLVLAMSVPALAENETGGNTTVKYTVTATYTVNIPESVTLGASGTAVNSNLTVGITNIPHNTCINAAITGTSGAEDAFTVKHTVDTAKTIGYTVKSSTDGTDYTEYTLGNKVGGCTQNGTIYFQYTLGAIPVGHPSGEYTGSVTFTISNDPVGGA